jgi:hypothetical protein
MTLAEHERTKARLTEARRLVQQVCNDTDENIAVIGDAEEIAIELSKLLKMLAQREVALLSPF